MNERLGLPSCSGLDRLHACPGSLEWSRNVEPLPDEPWTISGNNVHAVLALKADRSILDPDELYVADRCDSLMWDFLQSRGIEHGQPITRDVERLWMCDDRGKPVLSGVADVSCVHRRGQLSVAIIGDYKTGRIEVEPAPTNLQLRGLVACTASNYFVDGVEVVVVQPWASPQTTACFYDATDCEKAVKEVLEISQRAIADGGKTLVVGDHCKYCPAKGKCPATQAVVTAIATIPKGSWGVMSPEETVRMYHTCGHAVDIAEAFRADVKRRLKAGEKLPGLALKDGVIRTKILSVELLYQVLLKRFPDLSPHVFARFCSMTKTDLKDCVREASGLTGKALDELCKLVIEGNNESKQSEPTVVQDEN